MIKADYPDRESLEDIFLEALKHPRKPVSLRLEGGDKIEFLMRGRERDSVVGEMTTTPYARVEVNLNTQEVTIT